MSSFVHYFKAISEFKLELHYVNAQIRSKWANFFAPCELDIWRMTLKTIGHLFYATPSFVYNFLAIDEFKLELQSGNAQFWSKSAIFSSVTLKFDGWPWKTIGHLFYGTSSIVHHFIWACRPFDTKPLSEEMLTESLNRLIKPNIIYTRTALNAEIPSAA